MKTKRNRNKLTLPKQTIRNLHTVELKEVQGGVGAATVVADGGNAQCGQTGTCTVHDRS